MNEKLISYIWFNRLYYEEQFTLLGERVEIISPGIINIDSGPDVFNAKVKIGDRLWAGNVEFHVKASDWHRHGHDKDALYNHVILHVVLVADVQIENNDHIPIPTIVLRYPDSLIKGYDQLIKSKSVCPANFDEIEPVQLHQWIDSLLVERLQQKIERIDLILNRNKNNWEQAFFIILTRTLGLNVNSEAMQFVAQSVPLNVILHQRDNIFQLESLLLGQSGFLENLDSPDEYVHALQKEYRFLQSKYNLRPVNGLYFKFLRVRPSAFPTFKLAQLAMILHKYDNLFSSILDNLDVQLLHNFFKVGTSDYWQTHYRLCHTSEKHGVKISDSTVDLIIINAIVPFVFKYSLALDDEDMRYKILELLRSVRPENNRKVSLFTSNGFSCKNAYDSQALIQLYDNYCSVKNCLRCQIGHQYIKHF